MTLGKRLDRALGVSGAIMRNPYEAPKAGLDVVARDRCWNEGGKVLYVARGSDLPPRCVKCNRPVAGPSKKRSFYWHSSWWYLLIFVNLLIYAVVGLIVRKRVQLSPALCPVHHRRRQTIRWGSLAVCAFAAVVGVTRLDGATSLVPLIAFLVAFVALVTASIGSRIMYPIQVNEQGARFKGCGAAFLQSLGRSRSVAGLVIADADLSSESRFQSSTQGEPVGR